jgi:hypothetical protein
MLHYFTNPVGISKFVALIEPDNHASRGVARNTGFIESGLDTSGPGPMLRHKYLPPWTPGPRTERGVRVRVCLVPVRPGHGQSQIVLATGTAFWSGRPRSCREFA